MREILFRGKYIKTGQWVYGGFVKDDKYNKFEIYFRDSTGKNFYAAEVDKNTVGQFTGLTDKNGVQIFEGDLCLCDRNIAPNIDNQVFTIYFDTELGCWCGKGWSSDILGEDFSMCEVIGNIHDNPELLGRGR